MHSSRMRTARSLTRSRSICWGGGTCTGCVYLPVGCTCLGCVPALGVYLPGGCTCPGGWTCLRSVPSRVGCICPGGVTCLGVPAQVLPPCVQNSLHTLLKILPCPNFVVGGNNQFSKRVQHTNGKEKVSIFKNSYNSLAVPKV